MRIFLDSDVVISSLISKTGAASHIVNNTDITSIVSDVSLREINDVLKRLQIPKDKLNKAIERLTVSKAKTAEKEMEKSYAKFTTDVGDAKIIGSAHDAEAKYLITYNLRHYKADRIREELGIEVLTPALFLHHTRNN